MKLKKMKEIIDKAYINAEDCDVDIEVWIGEDMYEIKRIGQFGVVPAVTMELVSM